MNKKLLALAIGAAVAMPVSALADGPTLYGKINVSLESVEDELGMDSDLAWPFDPAATAAEGWVVRDNASRVGIKGSAETGVDGLKGLYLAEFGLEADGASGGTADTVFEQRNIYVGLNGGFGTLLLGNLDTPTKTAQGQVDQFNDTAVDMGNHVAGELRAPNVVAYASPKMADAVTVTVALWQGEGVEGSGSNPPITYDALEGPGDALSASVVYDKEGLYLALAMDKDIPGNSGIVSSVVEVFEQAYLLPVTGDISGLYVDNTRLVAGYSTDSFEVGFLYGMQEEANSGGTYEDSSMVLSGAYKTGDWKFKAQYGVTETDDLDTDVLAIGSQEVSATMTGIGADYALGKSTTASFFYAVEEAEVTGFDASGAYFAAVDGSWERTILSFGLEQKF